jgi:hypothetical protein
MLSQTRHFKFSPGAGTRCSTGSVLKTVNPVPSVKAGCGYLGCIGRKDQLPVFIGTGTEGAIINRG